MSIVLGIKFVGHDTGAALIGNEHIVAIAEERLNRIKHSVNSFPHLSIAYCLNALSIAPSEIELVVIDQVGLRNEYLTRKHFNLETNDVFSKARIEIINHHDAHAAAAFFASPFDEAAVLVYDGSGERFLHRHGVYVAETETLYRGNMNRLEALQKTTHAACRGGNNRFPYTFGVGKLYSYLSKTYLGFGPYNEGKTMGLAPYGDLSLLQLLPEDNWFKEVDGHVLCNAQITAPWRIRELSGWLGNAIKHAYASANSIWRFPVRLITHYHLYRGLYRAPNIFKPIRLPKPPRTTNDKLPDHYFSSVARTCQHILEQVAIHWGRRLRTLVKSGNICVSGGLGLNIDANRLFLDQVGFSRLFVAPAASDTGIALGCALWGCHMVLNEKRFYTMKHAYLGRPYKENEIQAALKMHTERLTYFKSASIATEAAELLSRGKILGWFQGGSEYGPRALGHRSILADARNSATKDLLNCKVKHREQWRPFAAAILKDRLSEFFDMEHDSPFMLLAAKAKPGVSEKVPSVIHIDNTSRIQTVTKQQNGRFYDLIEEFHKLTGVPIILNTSFNLAGEPIVESPKDALDTFIRTDIDCLILEDYVVEKK